MKGLIRINETNYNKLLNYHLENGFCILTAFRSELSQSENRSRNKQLMNDLKSAGYSFIKITGGFKETINSDNPHWDEAEPTNDPNQKMWLTIEESLIVPNYNINTKSPNENFDDLKSLIIRLGIKYGQDSVLISEPHSNGKAYYVVTNSRIGDVGSIDMQFNGTSLASISDEYFSSLAKTANKLKAKYRDNAGGFKFEDTQYIGTFFDEPAHTISGSRMMKESGALPVFGSHYYGNSTIVNYFVNENGDLLENNYDNKVNEMAKRIDNICKLLNK